MMYPRFKTAIQFYRDSDACYLIGECVELILITEEAKRDFSYKYIKNSKEVSQDMSVVPFIIGSGSHNEFRLKIGPSDRSSNTYGSVAFKLPNGDGRIDEKVSHPPKKNNNSKRVSNKEFENIKFIAAGLVSYMGKEFIDYSKDQSIENSNALDEKLIEYSMLPADEQYRISKLGMEGKSVERD